MAQKKVINIAAKQAAPTAAAAKAAAAPKPESKPKAAAPQPKPESKPKAEAKPKGKAEAKPKADQPKSKASTYALHLNKTGRLVISAAAAERLETGLGESEDKRFATITIEGKVVRLVPQKKEIEGAIPVRDGGGRPYVSATKQFKTLGWKGNEEKEGLDIEAKPYGASGFEFRLM